jgi:hypothetical protein
MIGRDGQVQHHDLKRWAREQASTGRLSRLEAHLLLVLATYCNGECICWPSRETLAGDTVSTVSGVAKALRGLEEKRLIWSTQGGNGRSARRELLCNPAVPGEAQLEVAHKRSAVPSEPPSSARGGTRSTKKDQGNSARARSRSGSSRKDQDSSAPRGTAVHTPAGKANNNNGGEGGRDAQLTVDECIAAERRALARERRGKGVASVLRVVHGEDADAA